ncbi:MAG: hypothetical protein K8R77_03110 [Anaerolineaceae bacterium]|nr:hypothetical protein [Anaerolineaceae bacterium]
MSTLQKIAWFQGRRDDIPNQELAKNWPKTKTVPASRSSPKTCGTRKRMCAATV